MEATASSASLYTLRGSYEYPDKSQKPQCYLWLYRGICIQKSIAWLSVSEEQKAARTYIRDIRPMAHRPVQNG
jgi:hypothetical protein